MNNFIGAIQPLLRTPSDQMHALPRVCGRGQCKDHDDAKQQLLMLFKEEHPEFASAVDNKNNILGGIFVFDCTPYELMEKAADETSKELIQKIYEDAIELAPFIEY
jgi:hypothetical protein